MGEIDAWLQRLSWLALISLPILLGLGGYAAFRSLRHFRQDLEDVSLETRTSRLLEILRLIEDPRVREARTMILIEVSDSDRRSEDWWEGNAALQRAAEQVCSAYDYAAGAINFDASERVGQFFLETWGEDVIRIHDVLERYLEFRRKSEAGTYNEFSWLAQEARLIHRDLPAAKPEHPVRTVIRHLKS